jgi:ParB family chromosome partitioning protein
MTEVRSLQDRGYNTTTIAEKLGVGKKYLDGIVRLLKCGEDQLVARVAAGTVPLYVAIKIATATDGDVQKALSDAYASGELRGAKLLTVQRIITQRTSKAAVEKTATQDSKATPKELAGEYERHTERQRALMRRATLVHERLSLLRVAFHRLLADQGFVAKLRAQRLDTMPDVLSPRGI